MSDQIKYRFFDLSQVVTKPVLSSQTRHFIFSYHGCYYLKDLTDLLDRNVEVLSRMMYQNLRKTRAEAWKDVVS